MNSARYFVLLVKHSLINTPFFQSVKKHIVPVCPFRPYIFFAVFNNLNELGCV